MNDVTKLEHTPDPVATMDEHFRRQATPEVWAELDALRARVNSWDRLVEALEKIEAEVFPHPREVHLYIDRIRGLAADALTEARSQHEGR